MNIAICDDMAKERALLAKHISTYFLDATALQYEDGNRLVENHKESRFDLILLDVLMPIINGIEIAEQIRKFDDKTPIIFVTTSEEFAVQSYRVLAFDYILKPITSFNMEQCFSRFLAQKRDKQFLAVEYLGVPTKILLDNIFFLESNLRKVHFHLLGNKPLSLNAKLGDFLEVLKPLGFCRCHKSFIVNLNHINRISGEDFLMSNGAQVKISRAYLSDAKKAYFDFIFGKKRQ